jgi:hypothetical protein
LTKTSDHSGSETTKETLVKNALILTLAALLLAGVACAATNSVPPTNIAQAKVTQAPPSNQNRAVLAPGEGSPLPLCPPGENCGDGLRLMAGEGSPLPLCPPGENCGDGLRLMAGEGSP